MQYRDYPQDTAVVGTCINYAIILQLYSCRAYIDLHVPVATCSRVVGSYATAVVSGSAAAATATSSVLKYHTVRRYLPGTSNYIVGTYYYIY